MKSSTHLLALASVFATSTLVAPAQTLLFEDTFERPASDDINASADGITNNTGSDLSAGAWTENFTGGDNAVEARTNIGGNGGNGGNDGTDGVLFLADGLGTSNAYVNHNFINSSIPATGGFSITTTISETSTINDAGQIAALAVGMSESEATSTGDAFAADAKFQDGVLGGNNTDTSLAISDFWIGLRGVGGSDDATLIWGTEGNAVNGQAADGPAFLGSTSIQGGASGGELRVVFQVPDFNAGSTVFAEIHFNDVLQGTARFQWSETDTNYIGLDGRGGFIGFERFSVAEATSPGPIVTLTATPTTISGTSSSESVTLDWAAGSVPAGATYEITADNAVNFPNADGTGPVDDPSDSGSVDAELDGTLGDTTLTIELLDGAAVIASAEAVITAPLPAYDVSQNLARLDENGAVGQLTLSLFNAADFPADGTYELTDDNNAAVTYISPTSGALSPPLDLDVDVDPTQGSVTFSLVLRNAEGDVFDTVTYDVAAVPTAPATATNLFSDSFDRYTGTPAEDNDIDSSTIGMSGDLAPLTYLEIYEANNTTNEAEDPRPESIAINSFDALDTAVGQGSSAWSLDHNFTDAAIASDGGLSISADYYQINMTPATSGDDRSDRFGGFGIGLTLEEVSAFWDESNVEGVGPRGSIAANVCRGNADFHLSVSHDDMVQVFADGILVSEAPVDGDNTFGDGNISSDPVNIRADFAFEDPENFAAGSFVFYRVYCENLFVTSGFFRLTHDMSNYIGFSSRATEVVELDNLVIATVDSDDMPYPGNPENPQPGITMEETVSAGAVTDLDFSVSGRPGVSYDLEISQLLDEFRGYGIPGDAVGGYVSGTPNAVADESGELAFPGIVPREGFESSGFHRGRAFHWPAP